MKNIVFFIIGLIIGAGIMLISRPWGRNVDNIKSANDSLIRANDNLYRIIEEKQSLMNAYLRRADSFKKEVKAKKENVSSLKIRYRTVYVRDTININYLFNYFGAESEGVDDSTRIR